MRAIRSKIRANNIFIYTMKENMIMKKKISCALLALLLAGQMMGAVSVAADETQTTYTAVERLAPQFEGINGVSDDGILTVQKGDKWGFVDITGKTVIDYKYDYASEMVDGVAVVGYLSEKEPYVDKESGESYEYYILYIVDKTGKETQLFCTKEQNYRYDPESTADWFTRDANGNIIAEVRGDKLDEIFIHDGVIYTDSTFFYRYDGSPIYITDTEKLDALLKENWNNLGSSIADTHMYFKGNDGLISLRLETFMDIPPVSVVIDLDGNIVSSYPVMASGDLSLWKYQEGIVPRGLQNTPEEYGVSYTYAPENGYVVAYNNHFNVYSHIKGDETVYTPGFGVMNADGEWVIEPVYDNVWIHNGTVIRDGYVTLKDRDGNWGMMNMEGEIVIPFAYSSISYDGGYAWLHENAEDSVGTLVDLQGQTYAIADADGNLLDVQSSYRNMDNNVRRITTTDGKSYLLSGTPDGTTFLTIEDTENMNIWGAGNNSGKYWFTKTDAGYGIVEIVIEETTVAETAVEETVEETVAPETEAPETAVEETEAPETEAPETEAPETEEVTVPVVKPGRRYLPVRGRDAVKQFARISKLNKMLDSVYAPVIRH